MQGNKHRGFWGSTLRSQPELPARAASPRQESFQACQIPPSMARAPSPTPSSFGEHSGRRNLIPRIQTHWQSHTRVLLTPLPLFLSNTTSAPLIHPSQKTSISSDLPPSQPATPYIQVSLRNTVFILSSDRKHFFFLKKS